MKRKFLSVFLLMCIVFSTLPTTAFAKVTTDSVVIMTADKKSAKDWDTITYTVRITKDSAGKGLLSASLKLYYDPDLISFDMDSMVYTPQYSYTLFKTGTDSSGTYLAMQNSAMPANSDVIKSGNIDVFKFKGTVKGGAYGKISFRLGVCNFGVAEKKLAYNAKIKTISLPIVKLIGIPVESVSLNYLSVSKRKDQTFQLYATCSPKNATDKTITWSSDNTHVATVNASGVVTTHNLGIANITAKAANGKYAVCPVTVTNESYTKLKYDDYNYSFGNKSSSFGYDKYLFGYKIPKERYMQLGYSESVAKAMVEKWSGNCFGMSASSVLFYKDILREENYKSDVTRPIQFDAPNAGNGAFLSDKWEVKLRHMIELFQISQKLGYTGCLRSKNTMGDIVHEIKFEINKGNPVLLGLSGYKKDNNSKTAGHEIVIYGYDVSDMGTKFYLYDCSDFVDYALYADGYTDFEFNYKNDEYVWNVSDIIPFKFILDKYNFLYNQVGNAIELLSLEEEPTYTYMFAPAGEFTITNSSGQVSKITDSEVVGEIEDVRLTMSSYLAENPTYTIILPTDEYTITGVGDEEITTSFADYNMSISVTAKASTPIKISSDLKTIGVDTADGDEYSVQYTVYDNIFDEMTLSGTAGGALSSVLDESQVTVSGIKTLTAAASVSGTSISASSEDLESDGEVTVKCEETDAGATIQILSEEKELTEKAALPERLKADAPVGSLESGTYEEGQTLTFEKDDETVIYYTTDGSVPSADNGIIYALPIDVNKTMTIKAMSTKYGYSDSDVTELNYVLPEITVPKANIASGEYDDVIKVELSTDDYNDDIYYTVNGENPLTDGVLYTTPLTFCESTCLKAYTLKNGCVSEIVTYEYTITPKNPFYFSNSLTNQDGEIITADNLAELTKIRLTLSKLQSGEHTALFFAAFYGADDKLICIKSKNAVISKDTDEVEIDIDDDVSSAYTIKTFAVKDLSTMQPMCGAFEDNVISE